MTIDQVIDSLNATAELRGQIFGENDSSAVTARDMVAAIEQLKHECETERCKHMGYMAAYNGRGEELTKLRGKIYALEKAGDAMDLLLTGSMKPSKGVRDAWASAKKL